MEKQNLLYLAIGLAIFFFVLRPVLFGGSRVKPEEAAEQLKTGKAVLIDVRESDEWAESGVAEPAVLLALSDLRGERKQWKPFLEKNRDKTLLLYCRSGNRSGQAAAILAKEGFKTDNAGSFSAWKSAGLPVRSP
jgi:rhodanese-related sulfurtransferase